MWNGSDNPAPSLCCYTVTIESLGKRQGTAIRQDKGVFLTDRLYVRDGRIYSRYDNCLAPTMDSGIAQAREMLKKEILEGFSRCERNVQEVRSGYEHETEFWQKKAEMYRKHIEGKVWETCPVVHF